MSRQALDLVLAHRPGAQDPFRSEHPWYGLVELSAPRATADLDGILETVLGHAFERGLVTDAAVAGSPAQRESLWVLREAISEAQNPEGPSIKHDVSVPIGDLPAFVERTDRLLEDILPGVRRVTYGHVGDGNLHYNLSKPVGTTDADFVARAGELSRAIYDAVTLMSGSISAEHGIGTAKRDAARTYKNPVELDLMRAVKRALDPDDLMNPDKVLPRA
jgi:FAD/FMN-containing dehydrogenase